MCSVEGASLYCVTAGTSEREWRLEESRVLLDVGLLPARQRGKLLARHLQNLLQEFTEVVHVTYSIVQ